MKNRIKILLITMLTALYCCGIVVPVSAEILGGKCGENVTWSYDEETKALTISGSGDMYNYSFAVNETINNLPPWNDKQLSKIVIEDGVTSVGNYAFAGGCNSPEEKVDVTISDGVKKIGKSAFSAKNIENCVIYDGVERIEKEAFSNSSVKKLIIPPSVKYVETDAFFGCDVEQVHITDLAAWCQIDFANNYANPMFYHVLPTSDLNEEDYSQKGLYLNGEIVSTLVMPDGIEKIGKYAFAGCESILGVFFSQSVKDIGEWAFYSCNNMYGVGIPKEVETIGAYAFASCPALKFLSWEVVETEAGNSNLKTIGDSAFEDCPILEKVIIPAGVERVGIRAFAGNTSLKSLTISENVGVIGESAFENCYNLETVTISSGLKKIEKMHFTKTIAKGYILMIYRHGAALILKMNIQIHCQIHSGMTRDCILTMSLLKNW